MKRILLIIPILLSLLVVKPVLAEDWWHQSTASFNQKISTNPNAVNGVTGSPANEIFGERYTAAQVNWIINSLSNENLGGLSTCLGKPAGEVQTCLQGLTSMSSPLLMLARANESMTNTKPASGIEYLAQKFHQLSPIQTANAQTQGTGFRAIESVQKIWVASRDAAFGLASFVIIVLAFMIMLRQKISAQAVVTAQSALPKVAIALVVITFSYAVAGLVIDLAYVVMGLFSALLAASGLIDLNAVSNFNPAGAPLAIFNILNSPMLGYQGWVAALIIILGGGAATLVAPLGPIAPLGLGIAALLGLVLIVLMVIAFFRIFIAMLKAYATALFLIIGGPFIALFSVINVGPGIGGWLRQLAGQLAVFVGITMVVAISHMIFWGSAQGLTASFGQGFTGGATNPYRFITGNIAGAGTFPGFGGFEIGIIGFFVGFGVLYSAPKIGNGLRDQIISGRGSYGFDTTGTIFGPIAGLTAGMYGIGKATSKGAINDYLGGQINRRGGVGEIVGKATEPLKKFISPATSSVLRPPVDTTKPGK